MKTLLTILAALVLAACSSASDPEVPEAHGTADTPAAVDGQAPGADTWTEDTANAFDCAGADEAACASWPHCKPVLAQRFSETLTCLESPAFAGCLPKDRSCENINVTRMDKEGRCWWHASDCFFGSDQWTRDASCPNAGAALDLPACP